MSRINPTDKVGEVIAVMGDKQQLALIALQAVHTLGSRIDPASGEDAGLNAMKTLDEMGIYGADLARLFTGPCQMNPTNLLAVCRAVQLGLLDQSYVAILAQGKIPPGVNLKQLTLQVQAQVPDFGYCHECQALPPAGDGESGVF